MNNSQLVSIAMTTFNGEKFLREQLDSIMGQTCSNIEIRIVDDCSTDKTRDILRSYEEKYKSKITVYCNTSNIGLVKNFEKAINCCKGEYIALCDQDDIWNPHKIERLVNEIGKYSLIYSDASLIDERGRQYVTSRCSEYNLNNKSDLEFNDLVFKNLVIGCTCLFKKDLLIDVMPIPEYEIFHDWWISIVALKRDGIKYLDENLVQYRQHESNLYGQRKGGVLRNVKSILFRNAAKVEDYKKRSLRLESMKQHHIFTREDRKKVDQAIGYYRAYTKDGSLMYYWLLVIKYYPQITTKRYFRKLFCA